MLNRLFVPAVAFANLFATSVFAQPMMNANEISAAAGFFHTQDADTGAINADVSYGRFFDSPEWELGARLSYQANYVDEGPDTWNLSAVPFVDYHWISAFPENATMVPFLGAFIGGVFNDEDGDGIIGPELGAKFYLAKDTFFALRYRYEWYFDNLDIGSETSEGNHVVTLGLGYQWQS